MSGFVYLIRNKDLYKIGITQNLGQRMKALKPDEILKTLQTENYEELEKELHKKYKDVRIPQTEYFRLDDWQIRDCKQILSENIVSDAPGIIKILGDFFGGQEASSSASEDDSNPFANLTATPFLVVILPILFLGGFIDLFSSGNWIDTYQRSAYWCASFLVFASPISVLFNWFGEEKKNTLFVIWFIAMCLWLGIGNFGTLAIH